MKEAFDFNVKSEDLTTLPESNPSTDPEYLLVKKELDINDVRSQSESDDGFRLRVVREELDAQYRLRDKKIPVVSKPDSTEIIKPAPVTKVENGIVKRLKNGFLGALSLFSTITTTLPEAKAEETLPPPITMPDNTNESAVEAYKPVIDIGIKGEKVQLDMKEIESITRNFQMLIGHTEATKEETFNQEAQDYILEKLGDKITKGLLLAQEKGFDISSSDAFHFHMLVDKDTLGQIIEKNGLSENNFENSEKPDLYKLQTLKEITDATRAIIFHCAEFPSSSEFASADFWRNKYQYRNIAVDDNGAFFLDNVNKDSGEQYSDESFKKLKKIKGNFPHIGARVNDFNQEMNTDYVDMAGSAISLDVTFYKDKEGVKLDEKLPQLRFAYSNIEGVKGTSLDEYIKQQKSK